MKSITDLPDQDLYPIIFSNLSIEDLFNCRLVNKQFKYFSDHTDGLNKLIIGQPPTTGEEYYWCYNNKLIENKDIISLKCFRSIKLLSIFNLDNNLKYLKINDPRFKLEELSKNLINLESLEFGHYYKNYNQQIINLKNLKVFKSTNQSIKLNAPKLEKIQFNDIKKIKLHCNTELIKHLITCNYVDELEMFKNLEIIELRSACKSINENLLITFNYLKQLKIFVFDSYYSYERIVKNSLIKILNDKMKSRRQIYIYLEGIKIESIDKLDEFSPNGYSKWKFRLNNYDLLDLNSPYTGLRYEELERCVNNIKNDLPSSFFDKFLIDCVRVDNLKDIDSLNWFLYNLQYLITLTVGSNVSLDEVLYNNLPNTIKYLTIYNRKDLNYDFILKLSKLIEFHTQVDKDLFDLAFASFLNLKYLKLFRFYFKGKIIEIKRKGKKFYLNDEKLDYNQLIQKCNLIGLK